MAGFVEQRQLMLARRPSAACEPAQKLFRQQRGRKKIWFEAIHELTLSRSGHAGRGLKKPDLINAIPKHGSGFSGATLRAPFSPLPTRA
jgi:hypothetical protein